MTEPNSTAGPLLTIDWIGGIDGFVRLIDQTVLPTRLEYRDCRTIEAVWEAIRALRVRGAPAIGIAAGYGVVVGVQNVSEPGTPGLRKRLEEVSAYLRTSRPTAVNLFWALERMERRAAEVPASSSEERFRSALLEEGKQIAEEDRQMCRAIGRAGAALIQEGQGVLTHCNAGGLATADYGTALAVLFTAAEQGRRFHVYIDETRPLLQGARLTAWELQQRHIDASLICDNMAAQVMKEGRIRVVIVGADRIAANGDTANKIGTYGVAVLARAHGIPFYVAAPSNTFDLRLADGDAIPIEQRDPKEVTHGFGMQTAPTGIHVYNPAFDVTPARLISGIITERGLIQPVSRQTIASVIGAGLVDQRTRL
jgi:methylthioribose-1-phosphate isomerase